MLMVLFSKPWAWLLDYIYIKLCFSNSRFTISLSFITIHIILSYCGMKMDQNHNGNSMTRHDMWCAVSPKCILQKGIQVYGSFKKCTEYKISLLACFLDLKLRNQNHWVDRQLVKPRARFRKLNWKSFKNHCAHQKEAHTRLYQKHNL